MVQIASGYTRTTDIDFADNPDRHRIELCIQNVYTAVSDR
jgi:hypothetical protein